MKKILITGPTRTGTTLIANFLNAQEGCVIYRDFLGSIFEGLNRLQIKRFNSVLDEKGKNIILANLKPEFWNCGLTKINDLTTADFSTLGELYDIALNSLQTEGCHVVGHKITRQEKFLTSLLNETDISVIYTLRDLRDVILSSKNRFYDFDLYQVCSGWKDSVNIAGELANSYPDRFYVLCFEDFVNDAAKQCARLSDFLGVDIRSNIKTFKDRDMDWRDNSAFHDLDIGVSSKASYRWKNHLSDEDVIFANYIFGDTLQQFGYEVFGLNLRKKVLVTFQNFIMSMRRTLRKTLTKVMSVVFG
jgi:hypothetical protein